MALELEETIMREIGLGMNYRYFNGSGSCGYIAHEAARRLHETIQNHHEAGDEIVAPIGELTMLVKRTAETEPNDYTLTRTWEVASYVIAQHIHLAHGASPDSTGELAKYLRENYKCTYIVYDLGGQLFTIDLERDKR